MRRRERSAAGVASAARFPRIRQFFLALLLLELSLTPALAQIAGKVVSIQGLVEVAQLDWKLARLEQELKAGALIRTGVRSRTALLLADETQLKVGPKSEMELKAVRATSSLLQRISQVATAGYQSLLDVKSGKAWLRSKRVPAKAKVSTPAVTGAIRSTEFAIEVAADGESFFSVLEGSVHLSNDFGNVLVHSGEQGRARIGEAPTKLVFLNPEDAVQWTLYYSAAISPRDHPFQYDDPGEARDQLARAPDDPVDRTRLQHDAGELEAALLALGDVVSAEAEETRAWILLEQNRLAEAMLSFQKVRPSTSCSQLGASLVHFRMNELEQAYGLVQDPRDDPLLKIQKATIGLVSGDVETALELIESIAPGERAYARAQGLLSNVFLVRNDKQAALEAACRAVKARPNSPSVHLDLSRVQ